MSRKHESVGLCWQVYDTHGLGVVVLTALSNKEWIKEDELAAELNIHAKQLRRALRYLEQEQVIMREHVRETKRMQTKGALAVATGKAFTLQWHNMYES